jgi:two-component sensor histidine kinase
MSPTRTGFGSRMIEKALEGYFQGKATIAFQPAGVEFTLTAPIAALTEE